MQPRNDSINPNCSDGTEYQAFQEEQDLENPAKSREDQVQINFEKHEKLLAFKAELFNFDSSFRYLSLPQRSCYLKSLITGTISLTLGGGLLAIEAIRENHDTARYIGFGALTGAGALLIGCTMSFLISSRFQACIIGKLNKPITLPANFNIDELNQLLEGMNFDVQAVSSSNDLIRLNKIIDTAIKQTLPEYTEYQKKLGTTVMVALTKIGLFRQGPPKIVLDYLIPDEKIVNDIVSTPVKQF